MIIIFRIREKMKIKIDGRNNWKGREMIQNTKKEK